MAFETGKSLMKNLEGQQPCKTADVCQRIDGLFLFYVAGQGGRKPRSQRTTLRSKAVENADAGMLWMKTGERSSLERRRPHGGQMFDNPERTFQQFGQGP